MFVSVFFVFLYYQQIAFGLRLSSQKTPKIQLFNTMQNTNSILAEQPPLKILLLVEPTPFNYISGYANRFQETLKYLKKAGDDVVIVTADSDPNPPKSFLGYPIRTQRGFELPMYPQVTCTYDFARTIEKCIDEFAPDVVHVTTPSAIVYPATLWAILKKVPLVMSYHTDLVGYAEIYLRIPGFSTWLAKTLVKFFHSNADLVLCTSPQLGSNMLEIGIDRVDVWQKGINTEVMNCSLLLKVASLFNFNRNSILDSKMKKCDHIFRKVILKHLY
jgi:glycosyltransferase involved in cell wall biosynthesis